MRKADHVFHFEFFRRIVNNIRMMRKIEHFKIIEIVSNAKGMLYCNPCNSANLFYPVCL